MNRKVWARSSHQLVGGAPPLFWSIVTFLCYFSRQFSQYFVETRTDDRLTLQSHLSLLPSMDRLLRLAGSGCNARKDNYTGWVIRNEDKKPSFIRLQMAVTVTWIITNVIIYTLYIPHRSCETRHCAASTALWESFRVNPSHIILAEFLKKKRLDILLFLFSEHILPSMNELGK